MANDGLSIRLENGVKLDNVLSKMQQRVGTRLINQSLSKGAAQLRKGVKSKTPKANKSTEGFKTSSRNVEVGQLRRSVKSGLRKKVNVGRNTFVAAVWFQEGRGKAKKSDDGFYARWVINRHDENAFGYRGGNNFLTPAVKSSRSSVRKIIGVQLAEKIAKENQKQINRIR
jgi:hypothetical protein